MKKNGATQYQPFIICGRFGGDFEGYLWAHVTTGEIYEETGGH